MSKNLERKKDVLMWCLIAGASFIFVFLCSISTSPFYTDGYARGFEGGDSAQYLTMGKEWLNGKVLYRDIFDHKGPVIYFINLLGFAICGTPTGVFLLQVLNMFISLLGLYKMASLTGKSRKYGGE